VRLGYIYFVMEIRRRFIKGFPGHIFSGFIVLLYGPYVTLMHFNSKTCT
jgi:hypothetical protein